MGSMGVYRDFEGEAREARQRIRCVTQGSRIRFDDPPGHWVALYAKGAARKDTSGFVQDL